MLRSRKGYQGDNLIFRTIMKNDYKFLLLIEGELYEWSKQFITGAELKSLAGILVNQELYLSLKDPWDDELINNDAKVDLARPGVEHFYVKHPLKFKLDGNVFAWNSQFITGLQLRAICNIDEESDIFLKIKGPYEDQLIEDHTKVDLARPGIEKFISKDKIITLIVSGKKKEWEKRTISFVEVVTLAFGTFSENVNVAYTVTYSRGPKKNPQGSMVKGDNVFVKNKMIFNVTATDKS